MDSSRAPSRPSSARRALHTSRAPVIFSHSSARALTNHARDVPDSILKLVPANGGLVMVNFNPGFVSEAVRAYGDSVSAWARAQRASGADSATRADSMRVAESAQIGRAHV